MGIVLGLWVNYGDSGLCFCHVLGQIDLGMGGGGFFSIAGLAGGVEWWGYGLGRCRAIVFGG
jgi:hypothetical protein